MSTTVSNPPPPLHPAAVQFEDDNLLSVDTHPLQDLLACGTIQGDISL